jgi:hypothetical protein
MLLIVAPRRWEKITTDAEALNAVEFPAQVLMAPRFTQVIVPSFVTNPKVPKPVAQFGALLWDFRVAPAGTTAHCISPVGACKKYCCGLPVALL